MKGLFYNYHVYSIVLVRLEALVVKTIADAISSHKLIAAVFPPLSLNVADFNGPPHIHFQPLVHVVCPGRPGTSLPAAGLEVQARVTGPVSSIIRRGGGNPFIRDLPVLHPKRRGTVCHEKYGHDVIADPKAFYELSVTLSDIFLHFQSTSSKNTFSQPS